SGHGDVLRDDLRVGLQFLLYCVPKLLVADCRLHRFAPSQEMCATGSASDRAARLFWTAAASAALAAFARPGTLTVRSMSARLGRSAFVRQFAETLTPSGRPPARRILRAVHASSEAIETMNRSSGVGASA